MKTDLQRSMAAGVFVEFHDADGQVLAQVVMTNWHSRAIPQVGDSLRCRAYAVAGGLAGSFAGRVVRRHFEVQHDDDGACVWVRLEVAVQAPRAVRSRAPRFSVN